MLDYFVTQHRVKRILAWLSEHAVPSSRNPNDLFESGSSDPIRGFPASWIIAENQRNFHRTEYLQPPFSAIIRLVEEEEMKCSSISIQYVNRVMAGGYQGKGCIRNFVLTKLPRARYRQDTLEDVKCAWKYLQERVGLPLPLTYRAWDQSLYYHGGDCTHRFGIIWKWRAENPELAREHPELFSFPAKISIQQLNLKAIQTLTQDWRVLALPALRAMEISNYLLEQDIPCYTCPLEESEGFKTDLLHQIYALCFDTQHPIANRIGQFLCEKKEMWPWDVSRRLLLFHAEQRPLKEYIRENDQ